MLGCEAMDTRVEGHDDVLVRDYMVLQIGAARLGTLVRGPH
jgi:hypothetical protein